MDGSTTAMALATLKSETKQMAAPWVSEIVLQTSQYMRLRDWYSAVLGLEFFFENTPDPKVEIEGRHGDGGKQVHASDVRMGFMRIPISGAYSLVLGIFEIPTVSGTAGNEPGLNHMQLKHGDLDQLIRRVELMRDAGMHPHRCANHGPMTSFYFRDPDENIIELCIDNFDTPEDMQAFIASEKFQSNPSGIDFQRDDFLARYHAGTPKRELLTY